MSYYHSTPVNGAWADVILESIAGEVAARLHRMIDAIGTAPGGHE